jgi:peroxiredoxin
MNAFRLRVFICVLAFVTAGCRPSGPGDGQVSKAPAGPVRAPSFILETVDGVAVSSEDLVGQKALMLVFWATWCVKCRAEIPDINALHDRFDGPTFEIVGVNGGESPEKVSRFLDKTEIRYRVLLDRKGKVGGDFRVPGFPWSVIIDRDGIVRHSGALLPEDPAASIAAVL